MLAVVPRMSDKKARALAKHYPTPRALMQALQDPSKSPEERSKLLEDKFDAKTKSHKLAQVLCDVMNSTSPHDKIT